MSRTLNQLIANAVLGGEEVEEQHAPSAEATTQFPTEVTAVPGDTEKLAAALEFIGRQGVRNLLEKVAMHGNVGTNAHQTHREHVQRQVGPHAGAPPMKPPGFGQIPNNAGKKPGGGREVDTAGQGHGTHHPALASNASAIAFDKKVKAKKVVPALGQVLDTPAFADGKLKENLSHTRGDKNIKKAHDLSAVHAELTRRAAGRTV
jgi:hypothetical protein